MKKLAALGLTTLIIVIALAVYNLHGEGATPQTARLEQDELGWRNSVAGWFNQAAASRTPVHYVTNRVERGDIRQTVTATGTLNALVTVEVGTQLSGQIAKLFVDFNDEVKRGQPLAQLDRKGYEAELAGARAATKMARTAVEVQRVKVERARINVLDAEAQRAVLSARVDDAKARMEVAESALRRIRQLSQSGTVTPSKVEEDQATRDSAAATLREVEAIAAAHELVIAGVHAELQAAEAELASALAGVPQMEAAELSAEIDLERTIIRSPVDGVVVGRSVDEGQTVAATLEAPTLFTIVGDLQQMEIYASVDEADIGKIKLDQEAVFTVDAYPNRRFPAVITSIRKAPKVDQGVVTYTVVLSTGNPESLLMPGMTAVVRINVHEAKSVLKVPMAALRYVPSHRQAPPAALVEGSQEGLRPAMVWRLSEAGREPEALAVRLGNDDGHHSVLVDGPLAEGDRLVVREVVEPPRRELFGFRLGF